MDEVALIRRLDEMVQTIEKHKIDVAKVINAPITDYDKQKQSYFVKQLGATIKMLQQKGSTRELTKDLTVLDIPGIKKAISKLSELNLTSTKRDIPVVPYDIRDEVVADIDEMYKCFDAGCYRSVVIICGRVMEVALHRVYYESTGQDILEKNPGIGLGKLIAKLSEKEFKFDPGLTQQIHLVNQVRIFSVHKKQDTFYPSKEQTQAMMLYTIDVLKRLF
ncbi:hypothetical protein H6504_01000 [Candidatus Woesearchaeota archaeon]|nr:hypothetical protein [Candidatus Woesearchaeota archaeon]